jgi:hypothetical protein
MTAPTPQVPRITQTAVRRGLRRKSRSFDPGDPAWSKRHVDVLGGAVSFVEHHNSAVGTRWAARAYTGNPARRWDADFFETLREAVAWANPRRQKAVEASAAELGAEWLAKALGASPDRTEPA